MTALSYHVRPALLVACLLLFSYTLSAQVSINVASEKIALDVGDKESIQASVMDEDDKPLADAKVYYYSRNSRIVAVDTTGMLTAHKPGTTSVIVLALTPGGKRLRQDVEVNVKHPPLAKIEFVTMPAAIYANVPTAINAKILDQLNFERDDLSVEFSTDNSKVAVFDGFNNITGLRPGKVEITATVEGITASTMLEIRKNPIASINLTADVDEALTGDVIYFKATAVDKSGKEVQDAPISFSFKGVSDDQSEFAGGLVKNDGRFVAYQSGRYTVTANCGQSAAQKVVMIKARKPEIERKVELVGRGNVTDKHTSDLWVWEGVDGRDYAVTGTWGADGEAFFWDVTDPANMVPIDTVQVDARTVNDVKVSEDGRVCIISREGASNRKNGIIILDVTNPHNVYKLAEYNDGLTGGVHNLFIYKDHVYALSNAERYDIINIEDPANPYKVGEFELETPGHSIHDVWIVNGLAYSSNWQDGVQIVDVGNGMAGGTPAKPVKVGSFTYPSGWNHAAFPFYSKSTGKFYVIAGDEAFPYGLYVKDKPTKAAGWLHVFDCTDFKNPVEVAKYEVPGAGSHNFWVDGDVLYVANYNAGLRVLDISGELLGDLYKQGREIGWYIPTDSKGIIPNAPMTWGPQPHKGHIFFSDWNSGLWSVKMEEKKKNDQ